MLCESLCYSQPHDQAEKLYGYFAVRNIIPENPQ